MRYILQVHMVLQLLTDKVENVRENDGITNGHETTIYILLEFNCWKKKVTFTWAGMHGYVWAWQGQVLAPFVRSRKH